MWPISEYYQAPLALSQAPGETLSDASRPTTASSLALRETCQHRDLALQQGFTPVDHTHIDKAAGGADIEVNPAFHGATAGIVKVLPAISWSALARAFADVLRRTHRRSFELVGQIGISGRELLYDLKRQRQLRPGRSRCQCGGRTRPGSR